MNRIGFHTTYIGEQDAFQQKYHELKFERDHWKERAEMEQVKKIGYKLLFLLALGYIIGKWWLL